MNDLVHFLNRLNDLMDEENLNKFGLSKIINCSNQSISKWYKKMLFPRHYILIRIADYFNCSVDYLLGLTNKEDFSRADKILDFKSCFIKRKAQKNLTSYHIAKQIGVGESAISKWILKNQIPQTQTLINLSRILDCSVEYLLGRSDF